MGETEMKYFDSAEALMQMQNIINELKSKAEKTHLPSEYEVQSMIFPSHEKECKDGYGSNDIAIAETQKHGYKIGILSEEDQNRYLSHAKNCNECSRYLDAIDDFLDNLLTAPTNKKHIQ
jgi:hypothetical protein